MTAAHARACPICEKPAAAGYLPFCSSRCADVDLQRWFSGRYAVAGAPAHDPVGDGDAD